MAAVGEGVWTKTLDFLRQHHRALLRDWFDDLEPAELSNGVLEIRLRDALQQRYLSETCRPAFVEAAQAATGRLVTVAFTLSAEPPPPVALPPIDEPELVLNGDYRFDHFVTGPCNRMAHAACVAVSESPGRAYNPLFIHGKAGLGKTHLLQAICHRIREQSDDLRILFLSCETFANHFLEAVELGALRDFRYRYRHVDLLLIDDVQLLADRDRSQEEFFHTFNTLYQAQKQIVLSSDTPPRQIPSLEERLISRFSWGLVARVDPPCLETRIAILRSKAKLRCIDLPEDVAHEIAVQVDANTRELEGALIKVQAHSQQFGGGITLALAADALGSTTPATATRPITLPAIVECVVDRYPVKISDLHSRKRTRSVAFPRQVCMYVAREMTTLSLDEIGDYFGGRDHTTVLHASRTIAAQRKSDPDLDRALTELVHELKQR